LLKKQAHALRSVRQAEKDRAWAPVDKVFKDFTTNPEAEEEEDEKEDKLVSQTPKQLGFPTYDENGLPDLNLVQEWTPKGQGDLAGAVQAAHEQDDQDLMDSDDLKGEHVLSAVGVDGDESAEADPNSSDFGDLNLVQVKGSSSDWVPKGQPGMKEKIDSLKDEENDYKLKSDGLKGTTVLSSVGMKGDKEDPLEFEFVQEEDSSWTPKNPLSAQVAQIKEDEHREKLKSDGLKGNSVLSSAGLDDDSKDENGDHFLEFVQQWQPKPLVGAHKAAAPTPVKAQKPLADPEDEEFEDDEDSSDEEQAEEYDKLGEESMGTDILGAGNMDHAKKQEKDSLAEVGALSLDDLKL